MAIIIRKMQDSDWTEVAKNYQQGIDLNIATFQKQCPTYEEWDATHRKDCRLVILDENDVAGWAALTPVSSCCVFGGVAEVSIYVRNDKQRKGLGGKLLEALIIESEKQGLWTLESGIMQDNLASIRLHETCGFRMVGYREKIERDQLGKWKNTVLMEHRSSKIIESEDHTCCQK